MTGRIGIVAGILFLAFTNICVADSAPPTLGVEAYDLRINLDLSHPQPDISDNTLHGVAQITIRNRSNASVDTLSVVLNRLLQLKSATDAHHDNLAIDQRLVELKDWKALQVRCVDIHLRRLLGPGKSMTLTLTYEGTLASYQETGMGYVRERLDPTFVILRPENLSYPIFAKPTRDAVVARWGNDAGVFNQHFSATVPRGERVVYNGILVAEHKGTKTTEFEYQSRQPSGFFIATIAHYGELERDNSHVLFFEQDRTSAARLGDALTRGMGVLTSWYGPLPSRGSSKGINVVEIPEGFGSQTISPMILQTADAFRDADELNQLYHELSHLWDVKDTDAAPCRYEEGQAMFVSALVQEQTDRQPEAVGAMTRRLFQRAQKQLAQDVAARAMPIAVYGQRSRTELSYTVGGVFFALLDHAVGREKFLWFRRTFRQAHLNGSTFADFVSAVRALGPVPNRLTDEFLVGTAGIQKLMTARSFEDLQSHYRA